MIEFYLLALRWLAWKEGRFMSLPKPPKTPGTFVYLGNDPNRDSTETTVRGVLFRQGLPVEVRDPGLAYKLRCINIGAPGVPPTFRELTAAEVAALKAPPPVAVVKQEEKEPPLVRSIGKAPARKPRG